MKKFILHIVLIIFFFNVMLCNSQKNKIRKNILAVIFPGGQYKNIYMKKLFDYSLNYNNEFDYYYDIVIHYSEKKLWEDSLNNDKYRNRYFLYTYGAISDEIEKYDIDDLPKQNLFKFYQVKLRLYNQDFLDSEVVNRLKGNKKVYSLLITDRPNYIAVLLAKELNINNKMYLSLRPLPQLFYQEKNLINPGFIPTLGSKLTDMLSFKERCSNFYNFLSERIVNFMSNYELKYLYNVYEYPYINTNIYFYENAIVLIQYPKGLTYQMSFPPHIIPLNPVALSYDKYENKFNNSKFDEFLNAHKNNIILSKEIFHQLKQDTLIKIMNKMNYIGFIYIYENGEEEFKYNINNLMIVDYKKYKEFDSYEKILYYFLNKNNICAMITNSNFNEIIISIFYSKPVISFGNGIYQQNINAYVKKNSVGIIINDNDINNYVSYVEAIKKLKAEEDDDELEGVNNNIYSKQCSKLSDLLRIFNNNPGKEYNKWLTYGMKNEYNDLKVPFSEKNNWFINNNYDIIFISFIIISIFFFILFFVLRNFICTLFCCCCNRSSSTPPNKNKLKKD